MRVVFMGTPDFAVPSLKKLAHDHQVALVITRPDAVRGRGKALEPSPVKECAQELGLPVLEANRMTPEVISAMREAQPEALCVVAFGCILPDEVISLAPYGALNVHASLLPRWRGAAPIQRAILAGDAVAGVSIMKIAHELDAGDWCKQASCEVGSKNTEQLTDALAQLGADALSQALSELKEGSLEWQVQDEPLQLVFLLEAGLFVLCPLNWHQVKFLLLKVRLQFKIIGCSLAVLKVSLSFLRCAQMVSALWMLNHLRQVFRSLR